MTNIHIFFWFLSHPTHTALDCVQSLTTNISWAPSSWSTIKFKGTMSRDFLLLSFFHESVFPQPQSIPFFRKFAEIFASQGAPLVSTTPAANFSTSFARVLIPVANLPPVSTIPAANLQPGLPLVSTTPVANLHRCKRHRWQTREQLSNCWQLKMNLKKKFIYMLTLLPKGVQKKSEDFFLFATVAVDTSGKPWAANISANFAKIWNVPNGIIRAWGKLIHEKNQKLKSRDTVPLRKCNL